MKNVEYFNAGAGSGKTYTLTEKIVELVQNGTVKPEQIILTTFTTKAANEFKEKVKAALYAAGLYDEAARLDQALIGTVHSVCERFIAKYWFLIGLMPDMGVMTEEDEQFFMSQSLATLPDEKERRILFDFVRQFDVQKTTNNRPAVLDYDVWRDQLKSIIGFTTNYSVENYDRSREESLNFIKKFVECNAASSCSNKDLDDVFAEHKAFLYGQKQSQTNDKRIKRLEELYRTRARFTVSSYAKLVELIGELKSRGNRADAFYNKFKDIMSSQGVYELQEAYINTLFELAQRWRDKYAAFKRNKNLIDFNDMEKYMLKLLEREEVCKEIKLSFTHLFVDEFQDSSPIQVKIFDKLSHLVHQSYWVGDYKQSIYGFRGSDISLVKAVVDTIACGANGCKTGKNLDTSYRSLSDIVETCNHVFGQTFSNVLDKSNIELKTHRQNKNNINSLRYFCTSKDITIADYVANLIYKEKVAPDDVAVLARMNKEIKAIAEELTSKYNIPVTVEANNITESKTFILVSSLLRIVDSPSDTLAKAQVAWLIDKDCTLEAIINSKMDLDAKKQGDTSKDFLSDVPLIARLYEMDTDTNLKRQNIAALVESVIIGLGLRDVVRMLDEPQSTSQACLQAIINAAQNYENRCRQMSMAATISGFIGYIEELYSADNRKGDRKKTAVSGDENGVRLYTYHGSKGLEQKYVILTSLNSDNAENDLIRKEIYGVHFTHTAVPSAYDLYPETYIRVTPWIFGAKKTVPDNISIIIKRTSEYKEAETRTTSERNRLLYVGMTRPRDVMLLDIDIVNKKNPLKWFETVGVANVKVPTSGDCDIFGLGKPFKDVTITQDVVDKQKQHFDSQIPQRYRLKEPVRQSQPQRQPHNVSPSKIMGKGNIRQCQKTGNRITLKGTPEMNRVGDCIHQIYSYIEETPTNLLESKMQRTIDNYGLSHVIDDHAAVAKAWRWLDDFLTGTFGKAVKTHHERPFRYRKNGQEFVGSIDLVRQTTGGDILIDFKTCPMGEKAITDPDSGHYAGNYAGQQNLYAEALASSGETVLAKFLYYPVSGLLVELE